MSDRYNEALEAAAKACRNEKFLAVSLIGEQYNDACDDCAKAILALREADQRGAAAESPARHGNLGSSVPDGQGIRSEQSAPHHLGWQPMPSEKEIATYRDTFRREMDKRMDTNHPCPSPSTNSHAAALCEFVNNRNRNAPHHPGGQEKAAPVLPLDEYELATIALRAFGGISQPRITFTRWKDGIDLEVATDGLKKLAQAIVQKATPTPASPGPMVMVPREPTELMIDAPRQIILYSETPGRSLEGLRNHLEQSGVEYKSWFPTWARGRGHLTKAAIAILVYAAMLAAAEEECNET